jgi:hypothetical protein
VAAVEFDADERHALGSLAEAGLVPPLRVASVSSLYELGIA